MSEELTPLVVAGFLVVACLLGRTLNRFLPQQYLSPETKDSMKLAVGWVATMAGIDSGATREFGENEL
jgi:hypothetical protein